MSKSLKFSLSMCMGLLGALMAVGSVNIHKNVNASQVNPNQVRQTRVYRPAKVYQTKKAHVMSSQNMQKLINNHKQNRMNRRQSKRNPYGIHLDYYNRGRHPYVVPNTGSTDDATSGISAPTVGRQSADYLNGRYSIWSRPGYLTKHDHYIPRGVRITSKAGSLKLALKRTPFHGIRAHDGEAFFEISSPKWTGWIPDDGLYGYDNSYGKLPVRKMFRTHKRTYRKHVTHKHVTHKHVIRKHVVRKHVARKHVARKHRARKRNVRKHVIRKHNAHKRNIRKNRTK